MTYPANERQFTTTSSILAYTIFFLSGAAALTYEISWSRQIGLLLGNTASAAATVLASYFVGLALGYAIAGRLAARVKRPLLAYGVLELTAATWALLIPWLLQMLQTSGAAALFGENNSLGQTALRAAICILLFLPATTALGGTLPLMARWLERTERGASRIAWAYGLNTFGGLIGVLVATIFLLAQVGVASSSYVAAAVSTACGFAAILLAIRNTASIAERKHPETTVQQTKSSTSRNSLLIASLVAVSGFTTLALEVLYTRLFALIFHNSTYTFGLVIAVVLCGLAIGAWLAAWAERRWDSQTIASWVLLLGGASISISTLLFLNRTGLRYFQGGETFAGYMLASFGLVALIVLPPSLLLGMVLPLLWNAATRGVNLQVCTAPADLEIRPTLSASVGRLTAVNTLAAAMGALVASFVLLPLVGLWNSFAILSAVCIIAGFLYHFAPRSDFTSRSEVVQRVVHWAALLATCCLTLAAWRVTTSQQAIPAGKTLVQRSEGAYGWIDVLHDNRTGTLSLRENVNYTHGSTASSMWERRQSHIPLLLHPRPRDVLYLGSGTGATAGGATMHDELQSIHVAELIPEVIDAARLFGQSNLEVFDDPRTQVHIDDARHYLLATDQRFDVIVSDLFVPWESKTGYLYTVDHYRIARTRLKPGGLFCQWLAMWQLGEGEFQLIADSFAKVFPNTTLWWGKIEHDRSIIGLMGCEESITIDAVALQMRMDRLYADPQLRDRRLDDSNELVRRFIGRWPTPGDDALLNTDERPRLEFGMPLTYADNATLKRRAMQAYFEAKLSGLSKKGVEFVNVSAVGDAPMSPSEWQRLQLRK